MNYIQYLKTGLTVKYNNPAVKANTGNVEYDLLMGNFTQAQRRAYEYYLQEAFMNPNIKSDSEMDRINYAMQTMKNKGWFRLAKPVDKPAQPTQPVLPAQPVLTTPTQNDEEVYLGYSLPEIEITAPAPSTTVASNTPVTTTTPQNNWSSELDLKQEWKNAGPNMIHYNYNSLIHNDALHAGDLPALMVGAPMVATMGMELAPLAMVDMAEAAPIVGNALKTGASYLANGARTVAGNLGTYWNGLQGSNAVAQTFSATGDIMKTFAPSTYLNAMGLPAKLGTAADLSLLAKGMYSAGSNLYLQTLDGTLGFNDPTVQNVLEVIPSLGKFNRAKTAYGVYQTTQGLPQMAEGLGQTVNSMATNAMNYLNFSK